MALLSGAIGWNTRQFLLGLQSNGDSSMPPTESPTMSQTMTTNKGDSMNGRTCRGKDNIIIIVKKTDQDLRKTDKRPPELTCSILRDYLIIIIGRLFRLYSMLFRLYSMLQHIRWLTFGCLIRISDDTTCDGCHIYSKLLKPAVWHRMSFNEAFMPKIGHKI